jgi:hypothetical protein
MVCTKFASVHKEMWISKQYESALALSGMRQTYHVSPFTPLFRTSTLRKCNLHVTGLLNCPKLGKNARIVMVGQTVWIY